MVVPTIWYVRTDFALYANDWPHLKQRLIVRSIQVLICLTGIVLVRAARTREHYSRVVAGVALAAAVFVLTTYAMRPQGSTLPMRTPLFLLFMLYSAMPNSLVRQIVPPLLLAGGLILLRLFWVSSGVDGDIAGDVLIVAVMNVVGIIIVRRRLTAEEEGRRAYASEREARLEADRHLSELSTLQGLLPICAHCKNIRTELGEWQRIEAYVSTHTSATFSHGICPPCMAEHYPQYQADSV